MKKEVCILGIIVLGIIIIINCGVYEKAKYEALNKSINGIMYEAKRKLSSNIESNNFPILFNIKNNEINSDKIKLDINGKTPDSGNLIAYSNTEFEIAFYYNGICAIKGKGDSKITYTRTKQSECLLSQ